MWKEIGHATGRKDVSVHELDTMIIFGPNFISRISQLYASATRGVRCALPRSHVRQMLTLCLHSDGVPDSGLQAHADELLDAAPKILAALHASLNKTIQTRRPRTRGRQSASRPTPTRRRPAAPLAAASATSGATTS